jgi:iron-sulfur cluster assembly accessory protein
MRIHESAVEKITQLRTSELPFMRIQIQAGGCSGFEKVFLMTDQVHEDDLVFENLVVVDSTSHELIKNAHLSYIQNLGGAAFDLNIPESLANCGCGKSFTI